MAKHPCGVGESEVEPQPPSADGGILLFFKKFELKNFPFVCEKWNKKLHLNKKIKILLTSKKNYATMESGRNLI